MAKNNLAALKKIKAAKREYPVVSENGKTNKIDFLKIFIIIYHIA